MVRYLHPAYHNLKKITKPDKEFSKTLDFKDMKFPVKVKDIQKFDKKTILYLLAFLVMKIKKKNRIYVSRKYKKTQ